MKYAALREIENASIRGIQPSYKTKTKYYLISSAILMLLGQAPNFDGRNWEEKIQIEAYYLKEMTSLLQRFQDGFPVWSERFLNTSWTKNRYF